LEDKFLTAAYDPFLLLALCDQQLEQALTSVLLTDYSFLMHMFVLKTVVWGCVVGQRQLEVLVMLLN
jgi:hypothetical protein